MGPHGKKQINDDNGPKHEADTQKIVSFIAKKATSNMASKKNQMLNLCDM